MYWSINKGVYGPFQRIQRNGLPEFTRKLGTNADSQARAIILICLI